MTKHLIRAVFPDNKHILNSLRGFRNELIALLRESSKRRRSRRANLDKKENKFVDENLFLYQRF
jgi:hypothetical protein